MLDFDDYCYLLAYHYDDSRETILFLLQHIIYSNKKADPIKRKICLKEEVVWVGNLISRRGGVTHQAKVESRIKAAYEGGSKSLEVLIKGLLSDNETANAYCFDEEIYKMVEEICDRQKRKKETSETIQLFRDEYACSLITCEMLFKAGVGFFTVNDKKVVLRKKDNYVNDEINITESLASLLCLTCGSIEKIIKEAKGDIKRYVKGHNERYPEEKIKPYSLGESFHGRGDKEFINELKDLFKTNSERNGMSKLNFPKNNIDSSPRGIISYLLENIV